MSFHELASVDGRITPTAEAVVPLKDDGLYRGDGAFEVIRLYGGRPYALADHLERLASSAARLHLGFDQVALGAEIEALLEEAGPIDAQLRLVITRGGRRIVATEPIAAYGPTISVATVTYSPTVILNGVKSLSYAANMHATRLAQEAGAEEAIFVTPEEVVLEPPTSGLFWVSADSGELRTAALDAGILASITRERVLRDLEAEIGHWPVEDLRGAREAFLASTTREIQAVASVDGKALTGAPGPRTVEAQRLFRERIERELEAEGAAAGGAVGKGAAAGG